MHGQRIAIAIGNDTTEEKHWIDYDRNSFITKVAELQFLPFCRHWSFCLAVQIQNQPRTAQKLGISLISNKIPPFAPMIPIYYSIILKKKKTGISWGHVCSLWTIREKNYTIRLLHYSIVFCCTLQLNLSNRIDRLERIKWYLNGQHVWMNEHVFPHDESIRDMMWYPEMQYVLRRANMWKWCSDSQKRMTFVLRENGSHTRSWSAWFDIIRLSDDQWRQCSQSDLALWNRITNLKYFIFSCVSIFVDDKCHPILDVGVRFKERWYERKFIYLRNRKKFQEWPCMLFWRVSDHFVYSVNSDFTIISSLGYSETYGKIAIYHKTNTGLEEKEIVHNWHFTELNFLILKTCVLEQQKYSPEQRTVELPMRKTFSFFLLNIEWKLNIR